MGGRDRWWEKTSLNPGMQTRKSEDGEEPPAPAGGGPALSQGEQRVGMSSRSRALTWPYRQQGRILSRMVGYQIIVLGD